MLIARAQVYWINWLLLIAGAAATGVAPVYDAFLRGAVASFLAAGALAAYRQLGPRKAAFLGLVLGVAWQLFLHHAWGRIAWSEAHRAAAEGRLGMEMSVTAAAFAGSALAAALMSRGLGWAKAAGVGALLSLSMTALPYGIVNAMDRNRAGPIDIVWIAEATALDDEGRPLRPRGVATPSLGAQEIATLRQRFLTVDVAGEVAVVGPDGRRLWPAWRQRISQAGHETLPARTVLIVNRLPADARVPAVDLILSESPEGRRGLEFALEEGAAKAGAFGDQPLEEPPTVRLEVGSNAEGVWFRALRALPLGRNYPTGGADERTGLPSRVPSPGSTGRLGPAPEPPAATAPTRVPEIGQMRIPNSHPAADVPLGPGE
jgi:hypothetical protein